MRNYVRSALTIVGNKLHYYHVPEKYSEFTSISSSEAEDYIKNSREQPVRKAIADKIGGGNVLDLGCANGIDAHFYSPEQYIGIDISPELIKVAKKKNYNHNFFCVDAEIYLDHCLKFDFIICKAVLEHQPSIAQMLSLYGKMVEKSRVLLLAFHMKPGNITKTHLVKGHFGKIVWQNEYDKKLFEIPGVTIKKQTIENYELWSITDAV